jgi:hypothetical protein
MPDESTVGEPKQTETKEKKVYYKKLLDGGRAGGERTRRFSQSIKSSISKGVGVIKKKRRENTTGSKHVVETAPKDKTESDIDIFRESVEFVDPNPRRVKRIARVYQIAKRLAIAHLKSFATDPDEQEKWLQKLYRWLLLCEQWPYRTAWMKQVIDDNAFEGYQLEAIAGVPLHVLYDQVVSSFSLAKNSNSLRGLRR